MGLVYTTMPVRRNYYGYGYPYYYPNYPYIKYPLFKDPKYFAMNAEDQNKIISGIAKVIVKKRKELNNKLVELGLACSCTIDEATEKDLSDIIVENIENKDFKSWLSEKIAGYESEYKNAASDPVTGIANAISAVFGTVGTIIGGSAAKKARKDEYKNSITQKAIEFKIEQEKAKQQKKTENTLMIIGASLLIIGVGFAIFYGTVPKNQVQAQIAT